MNEHVESRAARRRPWRWILAAIGALLAVAAALFGPGIFAQADAATAFGARIGCSCHFIGGRALDQCRADFEPGMGLVRLDLDETGEIVTARIPLLAQTRVRWREGWGCIPEPYE